MSSKSPVHLIGIFFLARFLKTKTERHALALPLYTYMHSTLYPHQNNNLAERSNIERKRTGHLIPLLFWKQVFSLFFLELIETSWEKELKKKQDH